METLGRDLAFAARLLRRSPVFCLVSVLTLSLGIGATTAVLSVANSLFVRPLPGVRNGSDLVSIHRVAEDGSSFHAFSYPDFLDYRMGPNGLQGISVHSMFPASLRTPGEPETLAAQYVSANYFELLGTRPAIGRFFHTEDEAVGAEPTIVLSHDSWSNRFEADPGIVGESVTLNRESFTVIGVAEPGFHGHTAVLAIGAWVPIGAAELFDAGSLGRREATWLESIGRREAGVSIDDVRRRLGVVLTRLQADHPALHGDDGIDVRPYAAVAPMARGAVMGFMALLLLTSALVLSIAGVNVAGLSLARALGRQREVAIRVAIGASRARLVRQFLTENLLLFLCGAAGGTLLAYALTGALNRAPLPIPLPLAYDVSPDLRVLGATLALAFAAGIVFGLAPALRATRSDVATAFQGALAGGERGGTRNRLGRAFVVLQVAGSVVLLVLGATFLRSLARAGDVELGFDPDPVHVMTVDLAVHGYEAEEGRRLFGRLREAVVATGGVEAASLVSMLPLNMSNAQTVFTVPGREPTPGVGAFQTDVRVVSPGYFATMRLPLLLGRDFSESGPGATGIIVSRSVARLVWGDENPIGRNLGVGSIRDAENYEVIGVARDAKYRTYADDGLLMIYLPLARQFNPTMTLVVRAPTAPAGLMRQLREHVGALDPDLPVRETGRLRDIVAIALLPNRIAASIAGTFGALGLLLATVGLYGILSFLVTRRTREIGIRMALGADPGRVRRMIWSDALRLAGTGLAVGIPLSVGLSLALRGMLFGVEATDLPTLGGIVTLVAAVAWLAAFRPARRATRLQPTEALRID